MGKTYKGVWGHISKLSHIAGGDGRGTRTNGWPGASLICGGDGGGQRTGNGKGRYGGTGCLGYYIESNLLIVDLQIGGRPGGGLLFLTTNSGFATLKMVKEYLSKLTNMPVRKSIKRNFTTKKKAELQTSKKN